MARAPDIASALRFALICLLALVALPVGGGPFQLASRASACESSCPCDQFGDQFGDQIGDQFGEEHGEEAPCEDDCDEDCSGCCDARTTVAIGLEPLSSSPPCAGPTGDLSGADAPGCRVTSGVFRPPRSLA